MKWGIYSTALVLFGVLSFAALPSAYAAGDINAVDSNGRVFDTYLVEQDIYVSGNCASAADTYVEAFVVDHRSSWKDDTVLVDRSDSIETLYVDNEGEVTLTRVWPSRLETGEYDIVLNLDDDNEFDEEEDCVTDKFQVINRGAGSASVGNRSPDEDFEWSVRVGNPFVVLLQIRLRAEDLEDLTLTSITLDASGTGDDRKTLLDVIVAEDRGNDGRYEEGRDTILGSGTYKRDNDDLELDLDYTIQAGDTKHILVVYLMGKDLRDDKTYSVEVRRIEAEGVLSGDDMLFSGLPIESYALEVGGSGDAQEIERTGTQQTTSNQDSESTSPSQTQEGTSATNVQTDDEGLLSSIFSQGDEEGEAGVPWTAPIGVRVALFLVLALIVLIIIWRMIFILGEQARTATKKFKKKEKPEDPLRHLKQ